MSDEDYLLGASDEELARLGFQHETWSTTTSTLWDRAGFRRGQRLLDLGCGPGFASTALAHRVGREGEVVAVDASKKSIATLRHRAQTLGLNNIDARAADASALELDGSFDGIFARWLFCFLPDARSLVHRASAWLKPGGTFAILDYFHYDSLALGPPAEVMPRLVKAVQASWKAGGGDLDVAGSLPTWLGEAGLEVLQVEPVVHCARPGTPMWHWPMTFFATYLDVLVDKSFLSAADADAVRTAFAEREANPNAFFMTPPVLSIIARKS